ncbi:MAG: alpha/beta hydrolase [Paracoccaceae bacterium]
MTSPGAIRTCRRSDAARLPGIFRRLGQTGPAPVAPLLLHRPDQRGYGQSWAPAEGRPEYTVSKLVGDMAELIADTDLAPVTVLGHDWGSAVAYGLAMMTPDLVSRLIVVNGVHLAPFQRALAAGGAQSGGLAIHPLPAPRRLEDILAEDDFARLRGMFSTDMDFSWFTPEKRRAYGHEWDRPGRLRGMINWYRASPLRVATPRPAHHRPARLAPRAASRAAAASA